MPFKALSLTEAQLITGNEVTVDKLTALLKGLGGGKADKAIDGLVKLAVAAGGSDAQLQQLTGQEEKFQNYARNLYKADGPYWNRIFGPVNVINSTTQRDRGMQTTSWYIPFNLNFHYQFRSFNGLSPKIVALDLIASFLNLTYNNAQFLHQLGRYFPTPGLKFSPTITEQLGKLLTDSATTYNGNLFNNIKDLLESAVTAFKTATSEVTADNILDKAKGFVGRAAQTAVATALKGAIPEILSVKSALSDRAVGEWHLVVGNPMNPIMVMGDLVCSKCVMVFDTEIGPDDFPTGVTFTVSLAQGKPRDKLAIERMFNLGEHGLMSNKLKDPASAADTFGTENNALFEELKKGSDQAKIKSLTADNNSFNQYRNRIRKSYGYDASDKAGELSQDTGAVNDSLLYMYFDKGLESQ
jgi:hypothetical protein